MNFKLSYEDAKKFLHLFSLLQYQVSVPFVTTLYRLNNEEGKTFKECLEKEAEENKEVVLQNPE